MFSSSAATLVLVLASTHIGSCSGIAGADQDAEQKCKTLFSATASYTEEYQARKKRFEAGLEQIAFLLDAQRSMIQNEIEFLATVHQLVENPTAASFVRKLTTDRRNAVLHAALDETRTLIGVLLSSDSPKQILIGRSLNTSISAVFLTKKRIDNHPVRRTFFLSTGLFSGRGVQSALRNRSETRNRSE